MAPEDTPITTAEELLRPYYHQRCILESPTYHRTGILHPNSGYIQFFYREGGAVRGLDFRPAELVLREERPVPRFATTEERSSFSAIGLDALVMKFYLRRAGCR